MLSVASALFSLGAGACGSSTPTPPANQQQAQTPPPGPGTGPTTGSPSGETGLGPHGDPVGTPTPDQSARSVREPPRHEGPAPNIANETDADAAIDHGWYTQAEAFYRERAKNKNAGRAHLQLARIAMETGRYEEAGRAAQQAEQDTALRAQAQTARAESLIARGDLDGAERVLTGVTSDPHAYRANVLLGRLHLRRGRAAEAEPFLMRQIEAYNDDSITRTDGEGLGYVAMSAWGLGSHADANDAFQEATRAAPTRDELQLEWAEMFLEKYDTGNAARGVREVLERNPDNAQAIALMARIFIEDSFDFASATAYAQRALEINPNLVGAHVLLAGMDLRDLDFAAADAKLATALRVDANDLEALSVKAAVRFLAEDQRGFEAAKREVLSRNRNYTRMYAILSEFADWEHRYPEIVAMAREAVTILPSDALAHATLGLNLLRMGDEVHGLESLREAWRRDRYNVHVFNTLNFYDDVIPQEYDEVQAAPFVFRMHKQERPILERYAPPTLRRAYEDMRRRYGFTPDGPVRIEMYADQQHFSIRTSGLPNIGVQGVCFGKVVTALSPRGGPFNWGQITWHELGHVFHIQLSRNRVPRWFTEGLAEYETIIARPEWRREEDHHLYSAIASGRIPPLRLLNRAFTHADSAEDVLVAYYAASQLVVYMAERFGFDKLVLMLRGWGQGHQTPQVIQDALGISIDQLDRDFLEHTRRRLAARANDYSVDIGSYRDLTARRTAAQAAPQDALKQAELAAALFYEGNAEEAKTVLDRALQIDARQPIALFLSAEYEQARGDNAAAERAYRALLAAGKDGYDIRVSLARMAHGRNDTAAALRELQAAAAIDRDRPEAWQGIKELSTDAAQKLAALREIVRIDQHDADSMVELLDALGAQSAWTDIVPLGESALMLDPHRTAVHRWLAEGYLQTNRARDALPEVEAALLTSPEAPAPLHLLRARILSALRRGNDARAAAAEAVRLDPSLREQADAIGRNR